MKYVKTVWQIVRNGIVVTQDNEITSIKCCDYIKKGKKEGYIKPLGRTAKQFKPLMGFTQEY